MNPGFVLSLLAIWIALDIAVLVLVNRWRQLIEQRAGSGSPSSSAPPVDVVVARIQRNGLRRVHPKEKPDVR